MRAIPQPTAETIRMKAIRVLSTGALLLDPIHGAGRPLAGLLPAEDLGTVFPPPSRVCDPAIDGRGRRSGLLPGLPDDHLPIPVPLQ